MPTCTLQFNVEGELIDPNESECIWLNRKSLGTVSVPSKDIVPMISPQGSSVESLKYLIMLLKKTLKHNFFPGLTVMAGAIMVMHYPPILEQFSGCPCISACGPSQTGKSTAVSASLAITGGYTKLYQHFCSVIVTIKPGIPSNFLTFRKYCCIYQRYKCFFIGKSFNIFHPISKRK